MTVTTIEPHPFNSRFFLVVAILAGAALSGAVAFTRPVSQTNSEKAPPAVPTSASGAPSTSPDCWFRVTDPFTGSSILWGVAVLPSGEVWAAGTIDYYNGGGALVARWDGSAWSPAYVGTGPGDLHAVKVLSTTNIWSVGVRDPTGYPTPTTALAIHWDGITWSPVPVPTPPSTDSSLFGLAFLNPSDGWAAGSYGDPIGNSRHPFIEHWSGTEWAMSPVTGTGSLSGIYAPASDDVWAVGDQGSPSPMVVHWDGTAWTDVSVSPPPLAVHSWFNSISGTSPSDIWAVGAMMGADPGSSFTLIMHWNGTEWDVLPAPETAPQIYYSGLDSVVALSPTDAWAAGSAVYSVFHDPIVLRWDGVQWNSASRELISFSQPEAVDSVSSSEAWLVGISYAYWPDDGGGALTARYQEGACPTPTAVPTATPPAVCPIQFTDVLPGSTYYDYVHCLACRGIINGYPDGTFKPNNNVTRGQLSKIVSSSAGFNDPQPNQMFQDVPLGSTFQVYIGRLASRGFISGYPCGGAGEPCVPPANLPYFRPYNNATRGQISKIVSNAAGFADPPSGHQFEDVAMGSTYYTYTYRLASRGVMSGYPCGGIGEPCIPPNNYPYFRPNNNATRGQTCKIVANTFFPNCQSLRPSK